MSIALWLALAMTGAVLALATDVPALPALHCPLNATDQCKEDSSTIFTVQGSDLIFQYDGDNSLRLYCYHNLQLDLVRAYLPRFTPALHVGNVTVVDCALAHYATVLAALNVKPTSPFNLELSNWRQTGRQTQPLTAAHFANLPPLRHLMIDGLYEGVLHSLPVTLEGLTTLSVKRMSMLDNILEALPRTLTELRLEEVNITRVPATVLDLPELRSLYVENRHFSEVTLERSNISRLQQLYVQCADAALLSDWAPPALEEVTLEFWRAERPNPLPACDKLVKLTLMYPHVSELPAGWLARCPQLKMLYIKYADFLSEPPARLLENATQLTSLDIIGDRFMTPKLTLPPQLFAGTPHLTHLNLSSNLLKKLPAQLFANTSHLTHLNLSYNLLTELSAQLFAYTPHLTRLDLNHNQLTQLPLQLFTNTPHLTYLNLHHNQLTQLPPQLFTNTLHLTHLDLNHNQLIQLPSSMLTLPLLWLDLGYNKLNTSVVAEVAATFTELRDLSLAGNRELGDLCADSNVTGISSFVSLLKLERLNLQGINISVICSDWRDDMVNLKYLGLSDTKLGNLTYEEMRYNRNVPAVVELSGTIYFTADDYDRAAVAAALAAPNRNVTLMLIIAKTLDEDCSLYWITKGINDDVLPLYDVQLYENRNENRPLSLRTVRAEDLLCPSKETCAAVPSGCNCGMTGDGLLRVVCVGIKLDRLLQLPSLNNDTNVHGVDLILVNNSITELVLNDLPLHFRVLELRNNSISYMTETTARALVSGTKSRVLLAGNRLICSGQTTPALRLLRDHVGYDAMRCEDTIKDGCSKFSASLATIIAALLLALWLARDKQ